MATDHYHSFTPLVSVIIPCFNEEQTIARCLASLSRSSLASEQFEVIVVDNGSTDGTVAAARQFGGIRNLTVIERPNVKVGAVRNAGARIAAGEWLVFLDSDCLAPPEWLSTGMTCLGQYGGVVGGPYGVPPEYSWVAKVWAWHEARNYSGAKAFVHGANLMIRRADFSRIGGFDESLSSNEDYELCQRAREAGLPVTAVQKLTVVHLGTTQAIPVFFRRERWHGRHVLKVFLRDLPKVRNLRAVLFASYMLAALCGALLGAVSWWSASSPGLLGMSLIAALALPMALGIQETAPRRAWGHCLPLGCLFLIYGIARALCWFDFWRSPIQRRACRYVYEPHSN